jgi:hypothetical protein
VTTTTNDRVVLISAVFLFFKNLAKHATQY